MPLINVFVNNFSILIWVVILFIINVITVIIITTPINMSDNYRIIFVLTNNITICTFFDVNAIV